MEIVWSVRANSGVLGWCCWCAPLTGCSVGFALVLGRGFLGLGFWVWVCRP